MRERSLYEVLDYICADSRAERQAPGELAAMVKPWLGNLADPLPCPDNAPLMLRFIADAPCWNRFDYRNPAMLYAAVAHYLLRAASHLAELEELEASLFLIDRGKEALRSALNLLKAPGKINP